ncbi:MAG: ImmA/IrrE family metallo-endopeptidase [Lachnospiraceae bacterium]|jgi:Zn-dependent peptidase ImmA (M78 family)|nr:ImmA/IrrE family metallo-endopeptidase [Lachnospiraceae bacterium]
MRSAQELNSLALKTRRVWGEDAYSPVDIFAVVNGWKDKKITVVKYPLSSRISGMCTKEAEDLVICINAATSYGRQRFTLAHELYHILYEENIQRVICDMSMDYDKPVSEKEADMFAGYLLMPYDALFRYSDQVKSWDLNHVIDAEQFFQISHMAMLFRLERDGFISSQTAAALKDVTVSKEAARLGYGKELYMPLPAGRQYFTTGEYIRKVELLAESGRISNGKREEFLMDAFRADIVYNLDEEEGNLND